MGNDTLWRNRKRCLVIRGRVLWASSYRARKYRGTVRSSVVPALYVFASIKRQVLPTVLTDQYPPRARFIRMKTVRVYLQQRELNIAIFWYKYLSRISKCFAIYVFFFFLLGRYVSIVKIKDERYILYRLLIRNIARHECYSRWRIRKKSPWRKLKSVALVLNDKFSRQSDFCFFRNSKHRGKIAFDRLECDYNIK